MGEEVSLTHKHIKGILRPFSCKMVTNTCIFAFGISKVRSGQYYIC